MPSDPAYQVYADGLMHMARGTPLWVPEPRQTIEGMTMAEIALGDVGYIKGGEFFRLFSAASPAKAQINRTGGVPKGFVQFKLSKYATNGLEKVLDPGHYFSTSVRRFIGGFDATGNVIPAAGGFTFACNKKQGAVLILKDKAIHQSINDLGRVDAYIKKHWKSWYTFATDRHKLRLSMGDLVMVTGFDKTSRWALAAFTERSESASIHFGVGLNSSDASVYIKGEWGRQEGVQSRSGPPSRKHAGKYDQCLFIQVSKPQPLSVWKGRVTTAWGSNNKEEALLECDKLAVDIVGKHLGMCETSGTTDILVVHDRDWMIPLSQGSLGNISAGPGDFFSHLYKGLRDANGAITKTEIEETDCKDLSGKVTLVQQLTIAMGGYADIFLGTLTEDPPQTPIRVAIKAFRGIHLVDKEEHDVVTRRLIREARTWASLDHPNILRFLGICKDFAGTTSLILPYCSNGNITQFLQRCPDCDRLPFAIQTTAGLVYLHQKGIVHGDLSTSNILITDDLTACLTDFGRSRIVNDSDTTNPAITNTIRYTAPEILSQDESDDDGDVERHIDFQAADVYSLAMVVLEILTGKFPFYPASGIRLAVRVLQGLRPQRQRYEDPLLTDAIWGCIEECWATEPARRPKAAQVLDRMSMPSPT